MSVPDVASAFPVSNSTEFLAETTPITPATAPRSGKFCGNRTELWLRMQFTYERWHPSRNGGHARSHPNLKAKAA
jgi:plasmid maintenance system antidote protein VapI